jgi:dTDP-4-amino-4,6-dideoxygalactose transaminase
MPTTVPVTPSIDTSAVGGPQARLLDLGRQHAEIAGELQSAIAAVVASGRMVGGPAVETFEAEWAAACGADEAIGVANGTQAITLILRAAGVGRGDEVVVPAMTFIATAAAVVDAGATPVLADVDPLSGLLDVEAASAALTTRTAAIMPVHLYGQAFDAERFRALADRHGLLLVEDAAQAQGATWDGRSAGSLGDAASFSFYPGKNLGALGDAGAVTTSDHDLAARVRRLRDHGRSGHDEHVEIGTTSRLDAIQAAALSVKLLHLERWNAARRTTAAAYDAALAPLAGVRRLRTAPRATSVHHQYVVCVDDRDAVAATLRHAGVETGVHYRRALHEHPAMAPWRGAGCFPHASALAATGLSLPVHPQLTVAERDLVIGAVIGAVAIGRAA